jgi:hypothetical protein
MSKKVLNIDNLEQSLWLVKVPSYVAEKWAEAHHDDILGSLGISLKKNITNQPQSKQLNITLDYQENGENNPREFTLETANQTDNHLAFSCDSESKAFAIEGNITKKLSLQPVLRKNQPRRIITNQRQNKNETKAADNTDIYKTVASSQTVDFFTSNKSELKRKGSEKVTSSKLARGGNELDVDALKSKIFESFALNERQLLKDIITFCSDLPNFSKEKDLREILDIYARYNAKGTYKHLWELKPEYKDYTLQDK